MTTISCAWNPVGDIDCYVWETSCGHAFVWEDGGPTENGARFCLYCGKPLVELPPPDGFEPS